MAEWDDGNGLMMRVSYMPGIECGLVEWCTSKRYTRTKQFLIENPPEIEA